MEALLRTVRASGITDYALAIAIDSSSEASMAMRLDEQEQACQADVPCDLHHGRRCCELPEHVKEAWAVIGPSEQ
ncbi:hypothetical protein GCM10009872_62530 [Actinopolymorpha rutila]